MPNGNLKPYICKTSHYDNELFECMVYHPLSAQCPFSVQLGDLFFCAHPDNRYLVYR